MNTDRSMTRSEYNYWRKRTRATKHLGAPIWWEMAEPTPSKAESDAEYARVARQQAIWMRVVRNRVRHGLPL